MKKSEEKPPADAAAGAGRPAEFLLAGGEAWVDSAQVIRSAVEGYAEEGNRIYEEYHRLKMDEFGEYRLSSDRARQARADNFRLEHCDRPLGELREKYVRDFMPVVEEVFRRQLQDINFPLE